MAHFASEFMRMNPIIFLMAMNHPRGNTQHVQVVFQIYSNMNQKHGSTFTKKKYA